MELSKEQREAVETIYGPVLLISCPGSGKTSVVVRRALHMVASGIVPQSILVLTFSKAAADEMEKRYISLLESGNAGPHPEFSTIHAFARSVLSYAGKSIDLITLDQQWEIMNEIIPEMRSEGTMRTWIKDFPDFVNKSFQEISRIKNNGVDWSRYEPEHCSSSEMRAIFEKYEKKKHDRAVIDYDDMLSDCLDLLRTDETVLNFYREKYRFLMIDEYQDTNFTQRDIIYLIAGSNRNLFVVGDDDQSIYRFRGAKQEIMLNFPKDFPSCKVIRMQTNYRSLNEIVAPARVLIDYNKERFSKEIKASREGKGSFQKFTAVTSKDEADDTADRIRELLRSGTRCQDIAVIYRNNRQAVLIASALADREIPYVCKEKIKSPYEEAVFQDFVSFYCLAEGKGDSKDLERVINKPNKNLTSGMFHGCEPDRQAVRDRVNEFSGCSDLLYKAESFFIHLERMKGMKPQELIRYVMDVVGYRSYLVKYEELRKLPEGTITALVECYLRDAERMDSFDDLITYARNTIRRANEEAKQKKEGVILTTMHSAKGLEWNTVFIIGANEGVVPSFTCDSIEALEEERRLFYVAMTRAKDSLYISWIQGKKGNRAVSRFVGETVAAPLPAAVSKGRTSFRKGLRVFVEGRGECTVMFQKPGSVILKARNSPFPFEVHERNYDGIRVIS